MAAQKGRDLLIKIKNDSGAFKTVIGLRAKTISLNSKSVDITHSESVSGWRELLPGAGVKTAQITGAGIFQDSASDELIRRAFFNQDIPKFQIIIPDFGILTGTFLVSDLAYAGVYSGEATIDLSLISAGALTFTAI